MDYLDYKSSGAEEDEVSLPQAILEKAVNLIDSFFCEICSEGISAIHTFLSDDLPNKILIIKDHLQMYIIEHNQKHLKRLLVHELKQYIDKKIGNVLKDLHAEEFMNITVYRSMMKKLKKACGLPDYL